MKMEVYCLTVTYVKKINYYTALKELNEKVREFINNNPGWKREGSPKRFRPVSFDELYILDQKVIKE